MDYEVPHIRIIFKFPFLRASWGHPYSTIWELVSFWKWNRMLLRLFTAVSSYQNGRERERVGGKLKREWDSRLFLLAIGVFKISFSSCYVRNIYDPWQEVWLNWRREIYKSVSYLQWTRKKTTVTAVASNLKLEMGEPKLWKIDK